MEGDVTVDGFGDEEVLVPDPLRRVALVVDHFRTKRAEDRHLEKDEIGFRTIRESQGNRVL